MKLKTCWLLVPAVLLGACVTSDDEATETLSAAIVVAPLCAAPCTVTVNLDGSFSPPNVTVNEGESVTFVAASGKLRTTDAVVRVSLAELLGATTTACLQTTRAYDITHALPGDDNELTGPLRRGTSGIYALGPEEAEGYYEGTTAQTCDDIVLAAGGTLPGRGETWDANGDGVEDAVVVGTGKLCRKFLRSNGKVASSNSPYILQSTWDNPDVTGGVVRINWRDLYKETVPGNGIYVHDYEKLDTELENAAQRGKLVFLELLAGDGIPDWLFSETPSEPLGSLPVVDSSQTELVARSVLPIETKDFGTSGNYTVDATHCGYRKKMGSPGDANYQAAVIATINDITAHIRASATHYQALGSLKVTGLNFLTGEMRLPKRCLSHADPVNASCWCNTRIWATPQNWAGAKTAVDNYRYVGNGDAAPEQVWAGGYTEANAQAFMTAVENAIFVGLGRRKTMHYMLIQDGFPKVTDATHYEEEDPAAPVAPNLGYLEDFDHQTNLALENGRNGLFRTGIDPDAPALFSTMNAALGPLPVDPATGLPDPYNLATVGCKQMLATALVNGKTQGVLAAPVANPSLGAFSGSSSGCPNKWANAEGRRGEITGYQTKNDIANSDELSSALWNETLDTNAVFLEAYEVDLWRALQERVLLGNAYLSTSAAGYASVPERQKSLADWTAEFHARRRTIANDPSNANNRHMKDPFPDSYTFNFRKNLNPATVLAESYFFINPAGRCTHPGAPQVSNLNYGQVTVLAQ
jgi:hypothetical protein